MLTSLEALILKINIIFQYKITYFINLPADTIMFGLKFSNIQFTSNFVNGII